MISCTHRRRVQHTVEYFEVLGIHRDRRSDDCKSTLEQPLELGRFQALCVLRNTVQIDEKCRVRFCDPERARDLV